jgi:hypothetical protein
MREERRGSWYLLTGVILGVAFGLLYSWVINPVQYVDAPPYALREDFKAQYRALVAAAYMYSGDLVRAQDRLAQLKDQDIARSLAMQAQQALAEGHPEEEVRALGILAVALGQGLTPAASGIPPTLAVTNNVPTNAYTPTPLLLQPTETPTLIPQPSPTLMDTLRTPRPTNTPLPTRTATPTATQGSPFLLQEQRLVCNPNQPEPLIQVDIRDAAGQPVPSIELVVTWDEGENHFFTGLKPELGLGYADFVMTPSVVYSIRLADGGQPVNDLTAAECQAEDGSRFWGSWLLIFVQP